MECNRLIAKCHAYDSINFPQQVRSVEHRRLSSPVCHESKSITQQDQPSRPQSRVATGSEPNAYHPLPRKDSKLLTAPLTAANYKDKFLLLNELEKEEHVQALERYSIHM